jgi:protein O-mannosyl-transferase
MPRNQKSWNGVRMRFSTEKARFFGLYLAVMALAFVVCAPSIGHDFCPVDDAYFVLENPVVQGGLTWAGIQSAWTTVHASYWAPLLWMSFMLDQELGGGAPWSFHLSNVVFFALSVGLVFALVRRWTGRNGVALATALLWAFHPARVESVAWIVERKDVLSGLFFLAGLWFYTVGREAGKQINAGNKPSTIHYHPSTLIVLSWLCMLLGGMAKQVVIVLPFALTLLDVWPLGRTDWNRIWRDIGRLTAEKWAFWLLAIAFACLPIWTHIEEQAIVDVSAGHRLAMIPIHYLFYLQKLVWPSGLAPLQEDLLFVGWKLGAGLGVLVGTTALLWKFRVKAPWALWGWLWFAGLLFPLSGVVWAGSERVAVRFLYLPQIGLTLGVVLGIDFFLGRRALNAAWGRALGLAVLLVWGFATLRTLSYWRDPNTFSLWIWTCHPEQGGACAMGGDACMAAGDWTQAMKAFEQGVALSDKSCFMRLCMLWNHLGQTERTAGAWDDFERALGRPLGDFAEWERAGERELLWRVRGQALRAQGDLPGAIAALKEAVRWEPDSGAFVLAEYLRACHEGGRAEEGAEVAERMAAATGIRVHEWRDLLPCYMEMWKMGARGYAYVYFADYAERFPEDADALHKMAWLLATARPSGLTYARMDEWPQAAVRWAEAAAARTDDRLAVETQDVLGAAHAYAGDFSGAGRAAEKARDLAREKGDDALAEQIDKRILTYRTGLPWRE